MRSSSSCLLASALAGVLLTACPQPAAVCGNGKVESGESCDDGNTADGDGCESTCQPTPAPECGDGVKEGTEACDDGNQTPGDGCENDCTVTVSGLCGNGALNNTELCDDGNTVGGDGCEANCTFSTGAVVGCAGMNAAPPATGTCTATAGNAATLITGVILTDGTTFVGGQVLVGTNGEIACVGCDCTQDAQALGATGLVCPRAVVSPGLINAHDHISYQSAPPARTEEKYEHRHDWRRGNDGHTVLNNGGNARNTEIRWAEVRQLMAGTTSIVGATYSGTGNEGLLRNIDSSGAGQLGLNVGASGANSDTFPLGDSNGLELTSGCGYPSPPTAGDLRADAAYLPHVAEGIEASAQNEFRCLSQLSSVEVFGPRTGVVHGIGLKAADIAWLAQTRSSLVWSPRSNVSLYGDTAAVALYKTLGVNIALGTDWTISGSMNLLRELKCADSLNANRYAHALSDEDLWRSVTGGSADATATSARIGRLAVGKLGDIAVYRLKPGSFYRSVIDAEPDDVVLTMRGGKALYGDEALIDAWDAADACETLDVCGTSKQLCLSTEVSTSASTAEAATTLASLLRANANTYPLFFCGVTPTNEPTCAPERSAANVKNGSTTYLVPPQAGDLDGDGVPDAADNCPNVFNPVRPMDDRAQADADADGQGDVCDVCPLNASTTTCTQLDPNDLDGDTVPNGTDNCPGDANTNQLDADMDGKGDVCDPCPNASNPGSQACAATIYEVKAPASPLVGQKVALPDALVTAVGTSGFFLQVHENETGYMGPAYSGLFCYGPGSGLVPGDRVNVASGTAADYYGQTQLSGLAFGDGGVTVISQGNPLPAPQTVDAGDVALPDAGLAAQLEGVLVRVENVEVIDVAPPLGPGDRDPSNEFVVTGGLRVNDYLHLMSPFPTVGTQLRAITGVLEWRNGNYKLEPRDAADILAGPAVVSGLTPTLTFVREGATGTIPQPLTVRLSNLEPMDVAVTVTASSGDVTIADGGLIIVPANTLTAEVPVTGVTANDAGVVLTATLGLSSQQATVRVLGAMEPARLVSVEPPVSQGVPGSTVAMKVVLDLPAPADTLVDLALVADAGFGSVPVSVTVPTDALEAPFDLTLDTTAEGTGEVQATLGADLASAQVTVQVSSTGHVVLSEVATRGTAGADDEFIELYNPTAVAVDISGWRLQYKSAGSADTAANWATKVTLSANASIAPRSYYLIGGGTYSSAVTPDQTGAAMQFSGTSGHVRLVDDQGVQVDRLGYGVGTSTPNAPEGTAFVPSALATNGSYERKALPTSTVITMSGGGADELRGNGVDSDDNSQDFVARVNRDPQNTSSNPEP